MKKIFALSFVILTYPAFGTYTTTIPNACTSYGDIFYARLDPIQYSCNAGEFVPANTLGCRTCPAGYTCPGGTLEFNEIYAQGLTAIGTNLTQNQTNACAQNMPYTFKAIITINSYTCNPGEFLPANTTGCRTCPNGYTCSGGTFFFNDTQSQGLVKNEAIYSQNENNTCALNFPHFLKAVFYEYICDAGYYLPANSEQCVICPENSYCTGGKFLFNETVPQGIGSCGTSLYAPTGMWKFAQCGRILNIGNEKVYLHQGKNTTPALHIDIDQDGTADFFGNMTTIDVPMTNGTNKKLKLQYGGQTYSVYDDSIDLTQYQN